MSIYKTTINKPITTILVFVAIIVLGVFSFTRLPVDQFPKMDPPFVMVMTTYPGANASELETNVTKILENTLNSVDGLKEISSSSQDNVSIVNMEVNWGENLDDAVNDIRSYIDMVYDELPDGVSRPLIFKFSSSSFPIIQYAITADESYPGLKKILEDNVVNVLNRVDGIGNISLSGAPERYVYVEIDPYKLDSYNLSLEAVGNAIGSNNLNLASGSVKMGKEQYQMRVQSEYVESSEINNIVVTTTPDGKQVFVRDVAVVRDTIKDISLDEKINGSEGVRLVIMKQTGANTVQIIRDIKKEMTRIEKTLPPDIKFDVIYDSSSNIMNAVNGLIESIGYALLFVVLVVLFFLGRWRATIIIAVTIPISLIVSFIYLKLVDSSLNIISLCSLTIAIGMVVDDAIVVLENIMNHIDRGENPREAAMYGTNEVWVSVIATTLVIVAVFVPLTMLSGQAGILFKELGWIVTITVCVSTLTAITLTPMLASILLKPKETLILDEEERKNQKNKKHRRFTYQNTVIKFLNKVEELYGRALSVCLNHKAITGLVLIALFVLSLVPVFMGKIGTDFMPVQDNGRMQIIIELQRGTRVEETMKTAREIEDMIRRVVPETRLISTSLGSSEDSNIATLMSSTNTNKMQITVRTTDKKDRERGIAELAEAIRKELDVTPEVVDYQVSTSMGGASTNSLSIDIYGYDFESTNAVAEQLKQALLKTEGARDIKVSREKDRSELQIIFDKEKMARHGLNTAMASQYVRSRVYGSTVGYLKEDGDEYKIVVRLQEQFRNTLDGILDLTINTPMGQQIKLEEIATIEEYWTPPTIERKRRERVVTVSATPVNISLGELAAEVQTIIDKMEKPYGVIMEISGDYEDQQETFKDMFALLALILMLVYIVMASQFESFSKPAILMMTFPFAISGVILALFITGTTLDMIGALGIVVLVGIAIKNGIVLIDYTDLLRDRGYELNRAIAEAGRSRLRPVLMTAITTILGMVPMALSTSEGSEMWVSMGIVVIGGMVVSTLMTLLVVPVLYAVFSRHGERNKEEKIRKTFIFFDLPSDEKEVEKMRLTQEEVED